MERQGAAERLPAAGEAAPPAVRWDAGRVVFGALGILIIGPNIYLAFHDHETFDVVIWVGAGVFALMTLAFVSVMRDPSAGPIALRRTSFALQLLVAAIFLLVGPIMLAAASLFGLVLVGLGGPLLYFTIQGERRRSRQRLVGSR
ncbi:hypothetical protein [Vulgatibacter sp.]|uniref:hypothetical protein n=1 Tax=Vulgatibacter sp. TaxID=1971226 RepID=UPI0035652FEC